MNIFEYVKGIKKRFSRVDVNSSLDSVNAELVNLVIPFLKDKLGWAVKDDSNILSTFYQNDRDALIKDFAVTGYLRPSNPFAMLLSSLQNSVEILSFIKGRLDKDMTDAMGPESLTLEKANLLQLLDVITFVSRYSVSWMEVIISAESNNRNNLKDEINLTQYQIKYLGDNRANFGRAIAILATPIDKIEKLFDDLPEIVLSEVNPKALQGSLGQEKVDPLRMNLIQSKWDPVFFISMIVTDYNASRYKTIKEEVATLELRVARLKKQMENKDDPHLAKIIENRQGQIDARRGKLKQMEEKVNGY